MTAHVSLYPQIPVHYIGQVCDYFASRQIATLDWLASVGLTESQVIEDTVLIRFDQYVTLIHGALQRSGQADLGLAIGNHLTINSHGSLGFALQNCNDMAQVLSLLQRFINIRTPLVSLSQDRLSDRVRLVFQELYDLEPIQPCFMEVLLLTVFRLLERVIRKSHWAFKVAVPYPSPRHGGQYEQQFGCPVAFEQDTGYIEFSTRVLSYPVPDSDRQALYQALTVCESELQRTGMEGNIVSQVRAVLYANREQFPDLSSVSKRLNLTPRTLHRRLQKQNWTFFGLLEQVKSELAKQYLINHRQSIKQVAYNLGYSDVANFRRAFHRWYGQTPQSYRAQNRGMV